MKIAVLSGKGGAGKTLVAVNLAFTAGAYTYADCDVEAPNGHLFFKPEAVVSRDVAVPIPFWDEICCTGCRVCVNFCRFNALAHVNGALMVFEDVCHSCGGCTLLCPQKALTEKPRVIGCIQSGVSGKVRVHTGALNIGEASGIPIVNELVRGIKAETNPVFIDCPPGSACIVMECIKAADYCILVTEPTAFGVSDLAMIHELVTLMGKPHGVVLNKCTEGPDPAQAYCLNKSLRIIGRIPFDQQLGLINSNGGIAAADGGRFRSLFASLYTKVTAEVSHEAASHS
jgi:MinD superfamily P-loop ATPase